MRKSVAINSFLENSKIFADVDGPGDLAIL
jgi:hypothetical protein